MQLTGALRHNKTKRWKLVPLVLLAIVAGCSSDTPPRGAVETTLSVTAAMGRFDPERGRTFATEVYVNIDGNDYPLRVTDGVKVVGEPGVPPMMLGGRRVVVAGDVEDGEYFAHYIKWLPAEPGDEPPGVTLGIPRGD